MIKDTDLVKKLRLQADVFRHHFSRKEYIEAKMVREIAGTVALFIEAPEDFKIELFGDRQGDEAEALRLHHSTADAVFLPLPV